MKNFFGIFKTKSFYIHFVLIICFLFLVFFITIKWLSSYTNHGEYIEVPDFSGKKVSELEQFVQDKNVSYQIIDSIYDPGQKPGIVLRQDPEPKVQVKHNRKVYLYVTGMIAPRIKMPKLIDRSERQARLILETYGLKTGTVKEKNWDCNGCVLAQMVDGKEIKPGDPIKKGTVVSLVVGVKDSYYNSGADTTAQEQKLEFD